MKDEALDLARFVALRDAVASVARTLSPEGIEIAPLKGALLVVAFQRGPSRRSVGDVDLLVRSDRFEDAVRILVSRGARIPVRDPDRRTTTLDVPGLRFSIDLHRRLFRRGLYRFDEAAILARGVRDPDTFGGPVVRIEPEDALAHAIAHHAGGRPLGSTGRLLSDLAILGPRLDRSRAIARLRSAALERALLFVERDLAVRGDGSALIDDLVSELRASELDRATARWAGALAMRGREISSLGRHLTNGTLPMAARSLAAHVGTSLWGALERRRPASTP